jgi:hypothetical protein
MTEQPTLTMVVTINGTGVNPWHRLGLRCNPFPQIGRAETDAAERQVASLDGDPVTGEADIRARLAGFTPEFIDGIVAQWRPGERVRFTVTFPDTRSALPEAGPS